jgi:hypothetical protein
MGTDMPDSFNCIDIANNSSTQVYPIFPIYFYTFWLLCVGSVIGNNLVMCNSCQFISYALGVNKHPRNDEFDRSVFF